MPIFQLRKMTAGIIFETKKSIKNSRKMIRQMNDTEANALYFN